MAKTSFQARLKQFLLRSKRRTKAGFTMTELLVSMIIAGVIISVLLSFVVDLVQTDRQEYVRAETQREMQTALDFMTNDLREAVYVYDAIEQDRPTAPRLSSFLPDFGANITPVLAFWKVERLPYDASGSLPATCTPTDTECNQVLIRRRAYSLVVYLHDKNPPNNTWKGRSRIRRYILRKYNNLPNVASITPGYADPQERTSFKDWPVGDNRRTGNPALPTGGAPVLVDFVDDANNANVNIPADDNSCRSSLLTSPLYAQIPTNPPYRRVPLEQQTNNSFFVCVKTLSFTGTGTEQETANQDVIIYLRGNPRGRLNNRAEPLETLKTQAVARGVVNKEPQ